MDANTLYFGDNLDILRRYVDAERVDLIYLDPPLNSRPVGPDAGVTTFRLASCGGCGCWVATGPGVAMAQ